MPPRLVPLPNDADVESRPGSGSTTQTQSGTMTRKPGLFMPSYAQRSNRASEVPSEMMMNGITATGPPQLNFRFHWWKIGLYLFFLMFCNLAIPCIIYYPIQLFADKISFQTNIGISSASLGLSSCFDAPYRLYNLTKYRKKYGPLNDDVWWHGDFFMHTYTFALLCFAFPLAIAPALTPVAIHFFLMSTAMLIQPFGLVLLFTLGGWKLPVWCSSDPPGSRIKPGAFYVMEDLGAVDFRLGREWRVKCYQRYNASPPFRTMMLILTYYWIFMTTLYTGITAAVTWGSWINFAFAWVLGQLFMWLIVASLGSWAIVHWFLKKEKKWWERAPTLMYAELGDAMGPVEARYSRPLDPEGVPLPDTPAGNGEGGGGHGEMAIVGGTRPLPTMVPLPMTPADERAPPPMRSEGGGVEMSEMRTANNPVVSRQ